MEGDEAHNTGILRVKMLAEHLKTVQRYLSTPACRVRRTGPLYEPTPFEVKLRLMRQTDHKNGTPSVARRPRLIYIYIYIHIPAYIHIQAPACVYIHIYTVAILSHSLVIPSCHNNRH